MKKQNIISHRGKFNCKEEGNNFYSFKNILQKGYGIETDIRDYYGQIYISHDISKDKPELSFDDFLDLVLKFNLNAPIALNIKTSGITQLLPSYIEKLNKINYFFFDMAIPDHLNFSKLNLINAIRMSELELISQQMIKTLKSSWIWYDSLLGDQDINWVLGIKELLNTNHNICIVSSELHSNDPYKLWEILKRSLDFKDERLYICTDLPNEAYDFFN